MMFTNVYLTSFFMILIMNFLKNIKSLQAEISSLPKYYNSHVWITAPGADGLSYLGIS